MNWYVYILKCKDGSFYIGSTLNVERRFTEHYEGRGGSYTRSHKPIKIEYQEICNSKGEALRRERQLKGWTRKKKEEFIAKLGKPA